MDCFYTEAARVIQDFNKKKGSLKTLVYSLSNYRNPSKLFALVSECSKYQEIINDVLKRCDQSLLDEELINNNHELAIVLLYELLAGNEFGHSGYIRKVMRKYKANIKVAQEEVLKKHNVKSLKLLFRGRSEEVKAKPRYARVNLIMCTVDEAIEKICNDGWEYVGNLSNTSFKEDVNSLGNSKFGLDPLLKDVLIFPAKTDLHDYHLVTGGVLVLQDRASCVPARVLNPLPGSIVLDCCAAPGNKTSHIASLMRDQGHIIAIDRDAKRMSIMKSLLQRTGATCVEMIVQDFLTLSPLSDEVLGITMILLDPSCSGSGMRQDTNDNPQRLENLQSFQSSLLKHALRFPNVERVVYSTCSVHPEENEELVEKIMSQVSDYFRFIPVMPEWPDSRGLEKFPNHKRFLRLSSDRHMTTGFFVACFERIKLIRKRVVKSEIQFKNMRGNNCQKRKGNGSGPEERTFDTNENRTISHANDADDASLMVEDATILTEEIKINSVNKTQVLEVEVESKKNSIVTAHKKKCEEKDSEPIVIEHENSLAESTQNTNHEKRKKKRKKELEVESELIMIEHENSLSECIQNNNHEKRKKKRKKELEVEMESETIIIEHENSLSECIQNENHEKRKKKRKKELELESEPIVIEHENSLSECIQNENYDKRNKKRKKELEVESEPIVIQHEDSLSESECIQNENHEKRKKKHRKKLDVTHSIENEWELLSDVSTKDERRRKKKKKQKMDKVINVIELEPEEITPGTSSKKQKKKKKKRSDNL